MFVEIQPLSLAHNALPQTLVMIHIGPDESPRPINYILKAERTLRRRRAVCHAERMSGEAIALMSAASHEAARIRSWGCSERKLRRAVVKVRHAAELCLKAAPDRQAAKLKALIEAIDQTLTILGDNNRA